MWPVILNWPLLICSGRWCFTWKILNFNNLGIFDICYKAGHTNETEIFVYIFFYWWTFCSHTGTCQDHITALLCLPQPPSSHQSRTRIWNTLTQEDCTLTRLFPKLCPQFLPHNTTVLDFWFIYCTSPVVILCLTVRLSYSVFVNENVPKFI